MKRLLKIFTLTVFLAILTGTAFGNDVPFAAFGISDSGSWATGNHYLIISLEGNQLNSATTVHVWNSQTNAEYLPTLWGQTLDSILTVNGFGNMQVMRAYAYVGDEGSASGSVDINSITVNTTTYSDTAFSTMSQAGGTYVGGSPGYMHLAYASPDLDAVVGVSGPLGTLNSLNMSFTYSNLTSSVPEPATMLLLGLGLVGLAGIRRKFRS